MLKLLSLSFIATNYYKRIISAIALVIIFLLALNIDQIFICLIIVIQLLMLSEWHDMLIFTLDSSCKIDYLSLCTGLILITSSCVSLIIIKINLPSIILLGYFINIWLTDTFAMIGGKLIGGPKLAPNISPNKTWSGTICGLLAAIIGNIILVKFYVYNTVHLHFLQFSYIYYNMIISILAQVSDLLVSIFKRRYGIKDSGTLIPGHGGVLDRFDSIILSAPCMLIFFLLNFSYKI